MSWTIDDCRSLSEELLADTGDRWRHVVAVSGAAADWELADETRTAIVGAAWLHDIGYSRSLVDTGMHAIDGARFLDREGAPIDLVSLVAYHTGAEHEADERGLMHRLLDFERPSQDDLDLLILADLVSGPSGRRVTVDQRIDEILTRYEQQHPVHRAVTSSSSYLRQCATRAAARVDYPM